MLELPRIKRRYFLECEMGTHTITPRDTAAPGNPPGATLSKADRYQRFLSEGSGLEGRRTHYHVQFPDAFAPEVLFLVLTAGRVGSVNAALASWRAKAGIRRPSAMRAVTFTEAAAELRELVGLRGFASGAPSRDDGSVKTQEASRLNPEDVALLHRYVHESVRSIKRARAEFRRLGRTDLPEYPAAYEGIFALLERLGGQVS